MLMLLLLLNIFITCPIRDGKLTTIFHTFQVLILFGLTCVIFFLLFAFGRFS